MDAKVLPWVRVIHTKLYVSEYAFRDGDGVGMGRYAKRNGNCGASAYMVGDLEAIDGNGEGKGFYYGRSRNDVR